MRKEALHDLLYLLKDKQRRQFSYAADDYFIGLLERFLPEQGMPIKTLKNGPFARLLSRPRAKELLALCGDGHLTAERLTYVYATNPQHYRISFDQWGDKKKDRWNYYQTSRGGFNLVLQLNYDTGHNSVYHSLRKQMGYDPFQYSCHPINTQGEYTLAWARIDLSEDWEEALIEEIQSDWYFEICERAKWWKKRKKEKKAQDSAYEKAVQDYIQNFAMPRAKLWPETVLAASLDFLWKELGTKRVFYHTYETGCKLKQCNPPRSLYTRVPKRFCFKETKEMPSFLKRRIAKKKMDIRFFLLE